MSDELHTLAEKEWLAHTEAMRAIQEARDGQFTDLGGLLTGSPLPTSAERQKDAEDWMTRRHRQNQEAYQAAMRASQEEVLEPWAYDFVTARLFKPPRSPGIKPEPPKGYSNRERQKALVTMALQGFAGTGDISPGDRRFLADLATQLANSDASLTALLTRLEPPRSPPPFPLVVLEVWAERSERHLPLSRETLAALSRLYPVALQAHMDGTNPQLSVEQTQDLADVASAWRG